MTTPVFDNEEFRRIRDLPTRPHDWSPETTKQAVDLISKVFGKGTGKKVRAIQARGAVEYADTGMLVAEVGAGFGKAQPLDEIVYTPTGPRRIGDLKVGDVVLSEKGTGVAVEGVFPQGRKKVVRVEFSDGQTVECCEDHLWTARNYRGRENDDRRRRDTLKKPAPNNGWATLPIKEIRKSLRTHAERINWEIPVTEPVWFGGAKALPVSAYALGVILGDGCTRFNRVEVTSGPRDKEFMLGKLREELPEYAVRDGSGKRIRIGLETKSADIRSVLSRLGVMNKLAHEKSIPIEYKYAADPRDRLALLQGLMDTDGWIEKTGAICFGTTSSRLIEDFTELVQSLGGLTSRRRSFSPKIPGRDTVYRTFHTVVFRIPDNMCPVTLPFKVERWAPFSKYRLQRRIVNVTDVGEKECVCISVESRTRLYLTRGFAVTHNTLMSFIVAQIATQRFDKKRILLVVPAKLREQTIDVHTDWSKHFDIPPLIGAEDAWKGGAVIRLLSYESLSVVSKATFLEQWRPDVIICDEAHFLARMSSARTKRMFRYVRGARKAGEDVHFIPLSGTMRRKSIRECAHIYAAAMQDMSPLPNDYPTLESWSFCLDEGVDDFLRYEPGALLELCQEDEKADLQGWRRAVRRRLVSTPGVIATSETAVDIPLVLQIRPLKVPDAVRQALAEVRQGLLPTGDEADSPIAIWQAARQLATGFSYRWVPAGPKDWLEARKNWNTFVREVLSHPPHGMHLDSPLQVWQAVDAGKFGHVPEQAAWRAIRDTFKPNPVPHWISDFMVKDAEEWALTTGGIVWVNHTSALEKDGCQDDVEIGKGFTKIPFFGAGDERIATYKGPCAASIRAHGTGRNLQQWSRALITCLPSSGSTLEQLLARHHRVGQQADMVQAEFYAHTPEMIDALETAQRDAAYAEGLSGQPQRVLSSNILDPSGHRLDIGAYRVMMGWDRN